MFSFSKLIEFGHGNTGDVEVRSILRWAVDEKLGLDLLMDARDETRRRPEVDGDDLDTPSQTAPESHQPFRPVFSPDDDAVAFSESVLV